MKKLRNVTGRPYPKDWEREARIKTELIKRGLTMTDVSYALNIKLPYLSAIINGRYISYKNEKKIASFLGLERTYLFPPRSRIDLQRQAIEQGLITQDEAVFVQSRSKEQTEALLKKLGIASGF